MNHTGLGDHGLVIRMKQAHDHFCNRRKTKNSFCRRSTHKAFAANLTTKQNIVLTESLYLQSWNPQFPSLESTADLKPTDLPHLLSSNCNWSCDQRPFGGLEIIQRLPNPQAFPGIN